MKKNNNCEDKHNSNKHMLVMVFACIIPMLLLFGMSRYFKVNTNYLPLFMILVCVGMHVWMMKKHKGGHNHG